VTVVVEENKEDETVNEVLVEEVEELERKEENPETDDSNLLDSAVSN